MYQEQKGMYFHVIKGNKLPLAQKYLFWNKIVRTDIFVGFSGSSKCVFYKRRLFSKEIVW